MTIKKSVKLSVAVVFLTTSIAHSSFAVDFSNWGSNKVYSEEEKRTAKEESREQSRFQKVSAYLSSARMERARGRFNAAKKYAEKALKVISDSEEAKAFLDQLRKEEKIYTDYQEKLKSDKNKEKEEKKQKKEEVKKSKRIKSYLNKSRKYLAKKKFEAAKDLADKAFEIDPDNEETLAVLSQIERGEDLKRTGIKTVSEEESPAVSSKTKKRVYRRVPASKAAPVKAKGDKAPSVSALRTKEDDTEKKERKVETHRLSDNETIKLRGGQPIVVDGDKVEYFEDEGKIVAEGNVSITYGDSTLLCDRIEVNTATREASCEGNVRIERPEGTVTSDRITYNISEKEGKIEGGELKAFPWFAMADETSKDGPNEYVLKNGYVTTCDHDSPHYRLQAEHIRVFPGEKVIARNVVVYLGKVPVMWMPYYYHPVIRLKANVQFIPGVNSDWGYFLLSAWKMHIKGDTRAELLLDYRDKKGFAEGIDLYYDTKDFGLTGLGKGLVRAYFIQQNGFGTIRPTAYRGEGTSLRHRKRYQWKHRINFNDSTVGMLELNKLSDQYVLKDYFYNEYEENNRTPSNYMSIITSTNNYIFSVEANKRLNDFYTVVERLPEIKIDVPDQRLWNTPFYYGTETSATSFTKKYATEKQRRYEKVNRLDTYHKLSLATGIGPLNLVPYGTFRETLYSKRKYTSDPAARMTIGGGLDAFMRFYRIFDVNTDALGLDINKLRHIIVPSAKYFHTHQPTVDRHTLFEMDEIDELKKENGVHLSLENKLQTKRDGGKSDPVDLVRSIISVDYLFRMKKNNFELKESGDFRDLRMKVELRPYSWLYLDSEVFIDPKDQELKTADAEFSLRPTDYFRLDLGYRYEDKSPDPRNQVTFDMSYIINPKWRVGIYERINLEEQDIEEQQFSITRDLHCWEVDFVYDIDGGDFLNDDFSFWVAFKIKAFPDLNIGLDRSYEKRAPGVAQPSRQADPVPMPTP